MAEVANFFDYQAFAREHRLWKVGHEELHCLQSVVWQRTRQQLILASKVSHVGQEPFIEPNLSRCNQHVLFIFTCLRLASHGFLER
jgi:hypothetical protein